MSDKHQRNTLFIMGILGLLGTIAAEHLESARAILTAPPFSHTVEVAAQMFVPAGSPTGAAPATHYWLSAAVGDAVYAGLQHLVTETPISGWCQVWQYDDVEAPDFPQQQLAALGLQHLEEMAA